MKIRSKLSLSSSFFNIHTFEAADLKQISPSDSKVQSKSPYLPADTLVDFLRMSAKQITSGLVRTIYTKKDFRDWNSSKWCWENPKYFEKRWREEGY